MPREFIDLDLANASLEASERALGFSETLSPKKIFLKTPRDLTLVKDFCVVESNDSPLLRKAARKKILVSPFGVPRFHKDDGLVRAVAEGVAVFEIPFALFSKTSFVYRAKIFSETRFFLKKCVKLRAPYVIVTRAETEFDLKTPRELTAFGESLGLSREQSVFALSEAPKKFL